MSAMYRPQEDMASPSGFLDFEDFQVGQRYAGGERLITTEDLVTFSALSGDRHPLHTDPAYAKAQGFEKPLLQGPFGVAAFFGWFFELGLARTSIVGLLDTQWRYLAPLYVGDRIHFEMTITRCQRSTGGSRGIVSRHVRVINQGAVVTQEGTTSVLVKARGDERRIGQELFTPAWAERLAERLNASHQFCAATATWDGAIGVSDGVEEIQFRIYRGRVLEAGSRSPNGATFTLTASVLSWAEMLSGPGNDFMRRAMRGAFSVRGAAYEYLRMTKAMCMIVDEARALLREGQSS